MRDSFSVKEDKKSSKKKFLLPHLKNIILLIKGAKVFAITVKCIMFILHVLTHIPHITNTKHSCQDTGNELNTSNNKGVLVKIGNRKLPLMCFVAM